MFILLSNIGLPFPITANSYTLNSPPPSILSNLTVSPYLQSETGDRSDTAPSVLTVRVKSLQLLPSQLLQLVSVQVQVRKG